MSLRSLGVRFVSFFFFFFLPQKSKKTKKLWWRWRCISKEMPYFVPRCLVWNMNTGQVCFMKMLIWSRVFWRRRRRRRRTVVQKRSVQRSRPPDVMPLQTIALERKVRSHTSPPPAPQRWTEVELKFFFFYVYPHSPSPPQCIVIMQTYRLFFTFFIFHAFVFFLFSVSSKSRVSRRHSDCLPNSSSPLPRPLSLCRSEKENTITDLPIPPQHTHTHTLTVRAYMCVCNMHCLHTQYFDWIDIYIELCIENGQFCDELPILYKMAFFIV